MGLFAALPLWPVTALCLVRTAGRGVFSGLRCGLGVGSANGLAAIIALVGLRAIAALPADFRSLLALCGSLIVIVIGILMLRRRHIVKAAHDKPRIHTPFGDIGLPVVLILSNPWSIPSLAAYCTILGLHAESLGLPEALLVGSGVVAGTLLLWAVIGKVSQSSASRHILRFRHWSYVALGILLVIGGSTALIYTARSFIVRMQG